MTRNGTFAEFETVDDFQRGYDATMAGKVAFRHGRYWIDDNNSAELARPEVVKGIEAAYRDIDARDYADTLASLR